MSPVRIGINGLGRIGRLALHHAVRRAIDPDNSGQVRRGTVEVVAINDIASIDELVYLLNHDSVHRMRGPKAERSEKGLRIGPFDIRVTAEREPSKIGWGNAGADIAIDCTGRFTKRDALSQHLEGSAPAKRVLLSAPGDVDRTIVIGVNEPMLEASDRLISCASCTTNALTPVLMVLDRAFGIRWGYVGTVHAYTAGQGLVDGMAGKDFRRGRAAAVNIVPTTTGAGKAVAHVLPQLAGKLGSSAVRVPVPNGSLFDVTCTLDDVPTLERMLEALRDAASTESLRGVLDVRDEALVSSDIIGDPHSSIVDVETCSVQGPLVRVCGWYDNEYGYAGRLLDLAVVASQKR